MSLSNTPTVSNFVVGFLVQVMRYRGISWTCVVVVNVNGVVAD